MQADEEQWCLGSADSLCICTVVRPQGGKGGVAEIYVRYANSGQHMAAVLTDNYDSHLSLIIMRLCIQFGEL